MEAAVRTERELSGEKARRIVDAMRSAVAAHGIAGATFERVAREAGVSRGLLHYYFASKERLLVEVVRRDTELRLELIVRPLQEATNLDQLVDGLVWNLKDLLENDPGYFILVFELFAAGRHNEDVERELAALFRVIRERITEILERKRDEGVISPPHDLEATVSHLVAIADGVAIQALSDPAFDRDGYLAVSEASARHLLGSA